MAESEQGTSASGSILHMRPHSIFVSTERLLINVFTPSRNSMLRVSLGEEASTCCGPVYWPDSKRRCYVALDARTLVAGLVRDVGPHEGKRDSQRKKSESTLTPYEGIAVAGIQVSSIVLTHLRWHPSQLGVMNLFKLAEDMAGDGESWNDSDLYRDHYH